MTTAQEHAEAVAAIATTPGMAELCSRHDWSSTPLGPREAWPQSLRTTVDIMLAAGHAMCLMWGPERTFLYNDAYAPFLGLRHPAALGMPTKTVGPTSGPISHRWWTAPSQARRA